MRWRYLILGVLCCVPVATAIQVWPPWPMFRIAFGRYYIGDDVANRQLLFLKDNETRSPPQIERYDADTGHLNSQITLECSADMGILAYDEWPYISLECSVLGVKSEQPGKAAWFDAKTGAFRLPMPGNFALFEAISPNGRYFARNEYDTNRLTMQDTLTGKTLFELEPPAGNYEWCCAVFSPDSRTVLVQWHKQGPRSGNFTMVNCETGKEEAQFQMFPGYYLDKWQGDELRTHGPQPVGRPKVPRPMYRHKFDGINLGLGEYDPLLSFCRREGAKTDGEDWVCRFDEYDNGRHSNCADLILKLEALIKIKLIANDQLHELSGAASILDRRSGSTRFAFETCYGQSFHVAIEGTRFVIGNFDTMKSAYSSFEIYRTDPWPRWVWTAMGVVCVMLPFVWFARRRHHVVMLRKH